MAGLLVHSWGHLKEQATSTEALMHPIRQQAIMLMILMVCQWGIEGVPRGAEGGVGVGKQPLTCGCQILADQDLLLWTLAHQQVSTTCQSSPRITTTFLSEYFRLIILQTSVLLCFRTGGNIISFL